MTDKPELTEFTPEKPDIGKPKFYTWTGDSPSFSGSLTISQNNETIVTFCPDGTIEVNPKYSATEAAQAFWDALQKIRGVV